MITRKTVIALIATTIAATSLGAIGLVSQEQDRPDCPGKIVCPITGELVCRDRCPLGEQAATDTAADTATGFSSCCRGRN